MSKPVHIPNHALRAERMQNAKFDQSPLVQSRSVGDRIKERNAWHRRKTYEAPAGAVQRLECGCQVFVAAGSAPECPMHAPVSQAA